MIFGISGKAYSGKDTCGRFLAEELNKIYYPPYVLMSFANELKLRLQKDFDLSYDQLWGDKKEIPDTRYPKGKDEGFWSPREMMQVYGEFYRCIDSDFWIKRLQQLIEDKEYENVIITDVRHKNEAEFIKSKSGFLIKLVRDAGRDAGALPAKAQQHISETGLDSYEKFDFIISNNDSLERLKQNVNEMIQLLKLHLTEFPEEDQNKILVVNL